MSRTVTIAKKFPVIDPKWSPELAPLLTVLHDGLGPIHTCLWQSQSKNYYQVNRNINSAFLRNLVKQFFFTRKAITSSSPSSLLPWQRAPSSWLSQTARAKSQAALACVLSLSFSLTLWNWQGFCCQENNPKSLPCCRVILFNRFTVPSFTCACLVYSDLIAWYMGHIVTMWPTSSMVEHVQELQKSHLAIWYGYICCSIWIHWEKPEV